VLAPRKRHAAGASPEAARRSAGVFRVATSANSATSCGGCQAHRRPLASDRSRVHVGRSYTLQLWLTLFFTTRHSGATAWRGFCSPRSRSGSRLPGGAAYGRRCCSARSPRAHSGHAWSPRRSVSRRATQGGGCWHACWMPSAWARGSRSSRFCSMAGSRAARGGPGATPPAGCLRLRRYLSLRRLSSPNPGLAPRVRFPPPARTPRSSGSRSSARAVEQRWRRTAEHGR
jgi:hypothetical protein